MLITTREMRLQPLFRISMYLSIDLSIAYRIYLPTIRYPYTFRSAFLLKKLPEIACILFLSSIDNFLRPSFPFELIFYRNFPIFKCAKICIWWSLSLTIPRTTQYYTKVCTKQLVRFCFINVSAFDKNYEKVLTQNGNEFLLISRGNKSNFSLKLISVELSGGKEWFFNAFRFKFR